MDKKIIFGTLTLLFLFLPSLQYASTIDQLHQSPMLLSAFLSDLTSNIKCPENTIVLLIIIDFDDFMCMNCLKSFHSFCRSIPSHILNKIAWGILVFDHDNNTARARSTLKIAQTKLRGFQSAYRIPFPILIDTTHMFYNLAREGTSLIVMDTQAKSIFRFVFPMKSEEFERIKMLLLDSKNH